MSVTDLSTDEIAAVETTNYLSKLREVSPSENTIKENGEKLYKRVIDVIKFNYRALKNKTEVHLPCVDEKGNIFALPEGTVKYVVDKLKNKGWNAKHYYKDGFNSYDFIRVEHKTVTLNENEF